MAKTITIGGKEVGSNNDTFFIAEIGSNHNGDMDLCRQLVDAAVECGVDAVKFQSWSDKSLISRSEYEKNTNYTDKKKHFGSLEEMVKQYQLTPDQHYEIKQYCKEKGIIFCSSPFSMDEADMLEGLDVPFFKIASMDINHLLFLKHVARKMRPIILSTGMATVSEIETAIKTIRGEGNSEIALLHCVALYPPDDRILNLRNIQMLSEIFQLPVGFSDHTVGITCPMTAIALGACIIEKHFTIEKDMEGWDHAISADPQEMKTIVNEGNRIQNFLGSYHRVIVEDEQKKALSFRRSLVAKHPMKTGHVIREEDLDFKRPGTGIKPDEVSYVVGLALTMAIEYDEILTWDHFK